MYQTQHFSRTLAALVIAAMVLTLVPVAAVLATSPSVVTDKPDYSPGETVIISGSGFAPGASLSVRVTWPLPDGRVDSAAVVSDGSGAFTYSYALGLDGLEDVYIVDVLDSSNTILATTTFTDSHFRFGHISWQRLSGRTVQFAVTTAWRTSFIGTVSLQFGDGSNFFGGQGSHVATLTDSNGNSYSIRQFTVSHTYGTDGPYTAFFESCCRIHGLVNASSASFRVTSVVDLRNGNGGSPVSSVAPILQMVQGGLNVAPLPVADPDLDPLTCRLATYAESRIAAQPAAGGFPLSVSANCELVWDTGATTVGQTYAGQVIIEENHAGNVAGTALDFIIEIVDGTLNQPPECTLDGNASNILPVGQAFSIMATGTDPENGDLTINHLGLPPGATLNPAAGNIGSSPFSGTFSWTPTSADAGSAYAVTVSFADSGLLQKACSFSVAVPENQPPTADAGGPYSVNEGSSVSFDGSGSSDPDPGDALTYEWDMDYDGVTFDVDAAGVSPLFDASSLDGPDSRDVALRVTDNDGASDIDSSSVSILNVAPSVSADNASVAVDEGLAASNSGLFSDPLDDVTISASVGAISQDAGSSGAWSWSFNSSDGPNESQTVTITATDSDGAASSTSFALVVDNVAPSIDSFSAPGDPVNIDDQPITAEVAFSDPGDDIHDVTFNWGDGNSDTLTGASSPASASHTYADPGVYQVLVRVEDEDGGFDEFLYQYVVIYDPSGGFVTGGGWIDSPAGAYLPDPELTGKANFGFVSKYKKGHNVPDGETEFQFQVADLNFHSSSYEYLVVNQDGKNAQFKGEGTINGSGSYMFIIWATDGDPDTFRIKIWDDNGGGVIYDNGAEQALGGGSIVVHKAKGK